MKTLNKLVTVIVTTTFCMNAFSGVQDILIGNKKISINYPSGYTNACEKSQEFKTMFASSLPPTHNLVACFIENKEFSLYPGLDPNADNPYLQVQELKSLSNLTLSTADFSSIRSTIATQQKSMFENLPIEAKSVIKNAEKEASKVLATSINLDVEGIIPLGILSNTENNIAFALYRKMKMESEEDGMIFTSEVIASNMVLVNGKLIILNVAKAYTKDEDFEIIKNMIIKWGKELKVPNK